MEFEELMASDAPEGGGSNAAVLGVNAGPLFNIHLKVDDPPTVRSLSSKVADALSFGLRAGGIGIGVAATGAVVGIGVLCYNHPEFVRSIIEKALAARGLQVGSVTPGSILVELHCYTKESFRSFMVDFEARKVQERLNKEFENSGYIGEELEVTMTNYKEACKFLEQISRYAAALRLLSRYNRTCYTSRLSLIVLVNVVLNRTVVVDSD